MLVVPAAASSAISRSRDVSGEWPPKASSAGVLAPSQSSQQLRRPLGERRRPAVLADATERPAAPAAASAASSRAPNRSKVPATASRRATVVGGQRRRVLRLDLDQRRLGRRRDALQAGECSLRIAQARHVVQQPGGHRSRSPLSIATSALSSRRARAAASVTARRRDPRLTVVEPPLGTPRRDRSAPFGRGTSTSQITGQRQRDDQLAEGEPLSGLADPVVGRVPEQAGCRCHPALGEPEAPGGPRAQPRRELVAASDSLVVLRGDELLHVAERPPSMRAWATAIRCTAGGSCRTSRSHTARCTSRAVVASRRAVSVCPSCVSPNALTNEAPRNTPLGGPSRNGAIARSASVDAPLVEIDGGVGHGQVGAGVDVGDRGRAPRR